MQFQVPQFIETEDKIFWNLTLKQFLTLVVGGSISFSMFLLLRPSFAFIITIIVMPISLAFAFYRPNGKSLGAYFLSALFYYWNPHIFIFRPRGGENPDEIPLPLTPTYKKPFQTPTFGTLKSLVNSLTVSKSAIPQREQPLIPMMKPMMEQEKMKERYELVRNITGDREVAKRIDYR
jgi:hypothetical protein